MTEIPSSAPAPELPQFIRAEVERAIAKAVAPTGMSTHDGKALIGHDKLRYMLALIDKLSAAQAPAVGDSEERRQLEHLLDDIVEEADQDGHTYYRVRDGADVLFSNMVSACARLLANTGRKT